MFRSSAENRGRSPIHKHTYDDRPATKPYIERTESHCGADRTDTPNG